MGRKGGTNEWMEGQGSERMKGMRVQWEGESLVLAVMVSSRRFTC